jgi:Fur family transcriptional regulator, peroxide stress response regulator
MAEKRLTDRNESDIVGNMGKALHKMGTDETIGAFKAKCREKGLKITPQRIAVYQMLLNSKEHPSADMVYNQVKKLYPNMSFDTVNRTLLTLSEVGAAFVVEGSGEPKRYDANLKPHQHFKCLKCRRIIDFHDREFDEISIPAELEEKFVILRKSVYFEGVCDTCLDEPEC